MIETVLREVRVDRLNEKGVFVAEQILNILHNTVEEWRKTILWWYKRQSNFIPYAFEIANVSGVIRFFFRAPESYMSIVENQIYAHFPNVEILAPKEYLPEASPLVADCQLIKEYIHPIKIYTEFKDRSEKETVDPLSSITSALSKASKTEPIVFRIEFSPILDSEWKLPKMIEVLASSLPSWMKRLLLSRYSWLFKLILLPLRLMRKFFSLVVHGIEISSPWVPKKDGNSEQDPLLEEKIAGFGYQVGVSIASYAKNETLAKSLLKEAGTALSIFSRSGGNGFRIASMKQQEPSHFLTLSGKRPIILTAAELAGFVHMPTLYVKTPGINWVTTKKFEPPHNIPMVSADPEATPLWLTNFRGTDIDFWILPSDRRRHIYVIGKTGMGKSTLLENMIFDDIMKGRGVWLIDPHGDLAETILSSIPKQRTNDVIFFDPSDYKFPIAFNMLEQVKSELRPIVASGLVSIFKRIFWESWGPRLEHIMRMTILTLLEIPDITIMSIPLMLTMKSYRMKIIGKLKDPHLVRFWENEYDAMEGRQQTEAAGPILNKVGQFLSSPLMRNILGQPKNPFSLRWAMDNKKIVIIKLPKWTIGEDSSALLGAMMVTKFQIDAMSRADIPENERKDFYLYVDEFQNFATDSFATILSEARKYKLNLVMANQFIAQMNETVRDAVFWNVGSLISFQVGIDDATKLSEAFDAEIVIPNDLVNLKKYDIYMKLLIDGMPSPVFSATTYPPIHSRMTIPEQKRDVVLKVSREKYAKNVELVEKKILEFNMKLVEDEKKFQKELEAYKEAKKEEKRQKMEAEKAKTI